jgi:hypothetical protein
MVARGSDAVNDDGHVPERLDDAIDEARAQADRMRTRTWHGS